MPNLKTTWMPSHNCFVKSLGFWFSKSGKRVPRHFHFHYPNTPDGERRATAELLPLMSQWQEIKKTAKEKGKPPVWFRKLDLPTDFAKDAKGSNLINQLDLNDPRRMEAAQRIKAARMNAAANPVKSLEEMSIAEAVDAFKAWMKSTGIKVTTLGTLAASLKIAFLGYDTSQPMATLNPSGIVDTLVIKTAKKKIRARTAQNYSKSVKRLCEWYSSKVEAYRLPKDFGQIFKVARFKNGGKDAEIFREDAEEMDFEIYSTTDLATIISAAKRNRPLLYVLLGLQAAMYYVDICDLKRANVHLDVERPFLLYKRVKESNKEPMIQKVWLWTETADLLRAELSPEGSKYALLSEDGKPMTTRGPKQTWQRLQSKLVRLLPERETVRFTDFRKTGGSAVSNISNVDLGELHLGHKIRGVGQKYIKLQKRRLYRPLVKWHDQLAKAGVFKGIK